MPYSLLLFDYDGTLCDSREAIYYSMREIFRLNGVPAPTATAIAQVVGAGLTAPQMLRILNLALTEAEVAEWLPAYRGIYAAEGEGLVQPFEGAKQVLRELTAQGVSVAVVSNKGLVSLQASLTRLGLLPYVQLLVGDGTAPERQLPLKPSPLLYEHIVRPYFPHIAPAATLMIGDTTADLLFARNCGLDACWASYGFGDAAACQAMHPAHEVASLREVFALVK